MIHKATAIIRPFETGYALGVQVLSQDGQAVFIAIVTADKIEQLPDIAGEFIDDVINMVNLNCGQIVTVPDCIKRTFGEYL